MLADARMIRFDGVMRALRKRHGRVVQRSLADPWELVLWENVGYLVRDERRAVAYRALERQVGLLPEQLLACKPKRLAKIIVEGGMLAEHRAEKVLECARVVRKAGGVEALRRTMAEDVDEARKILERFPGIGPPGADRILLLAHEKRTLAPDSNALRVMARWGWIKEQKNYGRMYETAVQKTAKALPKRWPDLVAAHQLLKVHGQSICTRKAPMCAACPLSRTCPKKGVE